MKKLLAGIVGIGLWCGPALLLAQTNPRKDQTKTQPKQAQMSEDMRKAIAFERAKDAADARQARLEARHPSVPAVDDEHSANRAEKDPGPAPVRKDQ